jgi:hypothetical protein
MLDTFENELLAHCNTDHGWPLVETFARTRRELPGEFEHGAAILAERLRASGLAVRQDQPSLYLGIPRAARIECAGRSFRS